MNLPEFKAWFEGYTEDLTTAPNAKQWKRIKAQVAKIDGTPTTKTVFIDRYHDYWPRRYWHDFVTYSSSLSASGSAGISNNIASLALMKGADAPTVDAEWDSNAALFAVGKADALKDAA